MKKICEFEVPIRAVSWKLKPFNGGKMILTAECMNFTWRFLKKISEIVPSPYNIVPRNREVELVLTIFEAYGENFKNPDGDPIPDLDHAATLVQNALEGLFYENDQQISSLEVHRWKVAKAEDEKIQVCIYEI